MKILIVLTSHDRFGDSDKKTGLWLEEFTTPYYVFKDAKAQVRLASPEGGKPPIDPSSMEPEAQTHSTDRFEKDFEAQKAFAHSDKLADVIPEMYDAVFYPGGHGPMWDLTSNPESISLLENMHTAAKPIAAVCHAPTVLLNVCNPDGSKLLDQRHVTGFSNLEEEANGLSDLVPFLLEDELKKQGGVYSNKEVWEPYSVVDGNIITGQNPASSEKVARELLRLLAAETQILEQPVG